jgi:hypothetical protein
MYRLTLGVKINGENGPQLIVKGETKEEAVASLRSFVNETRRQVGSVFSVQWRQGLSTRHGNAHAGRLGSLAHRSTKPTSCYRVQKEKGD